MVQTGHGGDWIGKPRFPLEAVRKSEEPVIEVRRIVLSWAVIALLSGPLASCDRHGAGSKSESEWQSTMQSAVAAYRANDLAKASELLDKAVTIAGSFGPKDPRIASAMNLRGVIAYARGDLPLAEKHYSAAKSRYEVTIGLEHDEGATILHNLGALYAAQARTAEAEPLLKQGLILRERIHGPKHPDVALSVHELATLYVQMKRYDDALRLATRGLELSESLHGPRQVETAYACNTLGLAKFHSRTDVEGARKLFERATAIMRIAKATDGPDAASFSRHLGRACTALGDLAAAEAAYNDAIRTDELLGHPDPAFSAICFANLTEVLAKEGKSTEAERVQIKADEYRRQCAARGLVPIDNP